MTPKTSPDVAMDVSTEEGEFGLEQAKELAGFFVRSPRRHRRLAVVTFLVVAALGFATATFWPRQYQCDVRILAQRNLLLPALDNPSVMVPHDAENPTKNAADAILKRDNIVAMIHQLDLLERWQTTRQPILRLKDTLTGWGGPRPEEERMRDMVDLLDKRLSVVTDDASITIAIEWPDRQVGFDIVSFLQKNFLEARYDSNVNVITEAIKILEDRAKPEEADVDAALADLTRIQSERLAARQAMAPRPAPGAAGVVARRTRGAGRPTAPTVQSPSLAAVQEIDGDAKQLEDVRRRIRILEEERDRQIAQAQSQLTDARSTLGPLHPTVLSLNEKLEALSKPSAELSTLDAQEQELLGRLAGRASQQPAAVPVPPPSAQAAGGPSPTQPAASSASAAVPPPTALAGDLSDDPQVAIAMARLQVVSSKYNELLSRIEAARIELEVTRAAFKFQYTVVRPPELARGPNKPNVRLIMIVTLALSVLSIFLIPGLLDLWRGRLLEEWEVERRLGIPLLGELSDPPP